MVGLLVVQVMVEVFLTATETKGGKVAREAIGKVVREEVEGEATEGARKVGVTPMETPSMMGPPIVIFSMVTKGSSSQLHVSPPHANQMPNPLSKRLIDCAS